MKVYSPNKEYTGISASVPFCNGTGETDDPHLIEWFKVHSGRTNESRGSNGRGSRRGSNRNSSTKRKTR